jgi:hypothetical protein
MTTKKRSNMERDKYEECCLTFLCRSARNSCVPDNFIDTLTGNDAVLCGECKMSGMRKKRGEESLIVFRETEHVHRGFEDGKKPLWYL